MSTSHVESGQAAPATAVAMPLPKATVVPLVIGVTSHRNILAGEIEPVRRRVREFFDSLHRDFPELPLVVLSALAEGGDQLVAHEALAVGASLVAPLPLPVELYVEDFADPAVRASFDELASRADIVRLPPPHEHSRVAIGLKGLARDSQYAKSGVYIASHCHILLAIWDGKDADRLGGTSQIVRYHLTGARPGLIERHREARHVLGEGDERLIYHIVCSRDDAGGSVAAGLLPLQTLWRSAEAAVPAEDSMPVEFRQMFSHMAEFNRDRDTYRAAIEGRAGKNPASSTVVPPAEDLFRAADWLALHFQKRVLLALRMTCVLAALMGMAFTFYAHMNDQNFLIYVFLLLFAIGAFVAILARRRGWHRKYLDYRALAEGLRIQCHWRRAGITSTDDHEFAHDNFLQKQNIELGWIRNVMRAASLYPQAERAADALATVIAEWVGESGKSGQLHYFECKTRERTGLHHLTETIGAISLWSSIAISVFLAVFAFRLSHDAKAILVLVMAALSIIAAVREAYAYRKADKELIRQYRFMQRIFTGARSALDRTQDPVKQRDILFALGDAALTEHAEWTLMHRERQVEHSKL